MKKLSIYDLINKKEKFADKKFYAYKECSCMLKKDLSQNKNNDK